METIFSRTTHYAEISLLKNYCILSNKNNYYDTDSQIFSMNYGWFHMRKRRKNKITDFFHLDDNYTFDNIIRCDSFGHKKFYTEKDKHIKKHYNNAFASLSIITNKCQIKKNGDKVILTFVNYQKSRDFNKIYFQKLLIYTSITFNTRTGNFTTFILEKKGKKTLKKIIRTNNFLFLYTILCSMNNYMTFVEGKQPTINAEKNIEFFHKFLEAIGCKEINSDDTPYQHIIKRFIEVKKIGIPNNLNLNNFHTLYTDAKTLKKHNNKLCQSFLELHGIKSKLTNKILNAYPNMDMVSFIKIVKILKRNSHILNKINFQNINNLNQKEQSHPDFTNKIHRNQTISSEVTSVFINELDKNKIIDKFLLLLDDLNNTSIISSIIIDEFMDHIRMVLDLKIAGVEFNVQFRNIEEFREEHLRLSQMLVEIKRKHIISKEYSEKLINAVEKNKYTSYDGEYDYYILKNQNEYDEEGSYMHHCVASYAEKNTSIIISIRKKGHRDRVTCEYNVGDGSNIQSKYFCNGMPPENFYEPIQNLNRIINTNKNILMPIATTYIKNEKYQKELDVPNFF